MINPPVPRNIDAIGSMATTRSTRKSTRPGTTTSPTGRASTAALEVPAMPSSVTPMQPTHTDRGTKAATEALSRGLGLGLGRSRTAGRSTGPGRCRHMGGSQGGVTVAKLVRPPRTRHTRPRARLRSTQPPLRARGLAWVVASRVGDPRRCRRTLNASSATLPRCTVRVRTTARLPWHRRLGQPPAPAAASTSLGVATSIHTDTGMDTGISTGVSTMMCLAASTAAQ